MLHYSELTEQERKCICNGCGPKGVFKVPDFIFGASCNQHDFYYWRGGKEKDRSEADWSFYQAMLADCEWYEEMLGEAVRCGAHGITERLVEIGRIQKYRTLATAYYCAVRAWGWRFFNYRKVPRGRKELDEAVEECLVSTEEGCYGC